MSCLNVQGDAATNRAKMKRECVWESQREKCELGNQWLLRSWITPLAPRGSKLAWLWIPLLAIKKRHHTLIHLIYNHYQTWCPFILICFLAFCLVPSCLFHFGGGLLTRQLASNGFFTPARCHSWSLPMLRGNAYCKCCEGMQTYLGKTRICTMNIQQNMRQAQVT